MTRLTKRFYLDWRKGGLIVVALLVCAPVFAQTAVDLNLSEEDVRLIGGAGEGIGERVATGDFNGDGYADIAISGLAASSGAGKVYVKLGGTSLASSITLSSAADMTVLGRAANDGMGNWLASGDINHDGYDDLIIGAKNADPSTGASAGEVYVIFGAATLIATIDLSVTSADLEVKGSNQADLLGAAVASGDLDSDGVDDLIFSATDTSPLSRTKAGIVYVVYGDSTAGGLPTVIDLSSTSADIEIYGKLAQDLVGSSLATGDMDNDGYDDLFIGSTSAPSGQFTGEAYVVLGRSRALFGSTLDLASSADLSVTGQKGFDFLAWMVSGGDVNRDGYDDLLIGAPNATGNGAGSGIGYVVYGSSSVSGTIDLSTTSASVSVLGASASIFLGWDVQAINLDGDGFGDLVISAPFASPPGGAGAGEVYSYSGMPSLPDTIDMTITTPDLTVQGDDASDQLGTGVAGGDINGDGVDDLIIGASVASEGYIIYGIPPHVELSLPNLSSLYDLTVTMPISIDSTSGMMMVESEMHIAFDTDLLTFSAANAGALTSAWTLGTTIAPGSGSSVDTVKVTGTNPGAPLTSAGEFINLDFLVKNLGQPITSPVSFEQVTFNLGRPEWNQTTNGSVKLLGRNGLLATTLLSAPADTIRVRLTDYDLNLDSGNIETHSVTLQNSVTGEQESLTLTEQSVDDSVFFGSIATVFGTGTSGDGFFNTQPNDELHVTYSDALDGQGAASTAMDTNLVVVFGDADGGGSLQAYDSALILSHAANHLTLTGLNLLVANLDIDAPASAITAFDAALAIQRRLGLISRFPVQEPTSKNHPQPETTNNPKPVVEERYLALVSTDDYISVRADERSEILAADLVLKGIEGRIEMAPEMELFEMVYRNAEDGLHVAFAGPRAVEGRGELFRIYPTSASAQVRALSGHFNGGRIAAYLDQSRSLATRPLRLALHPNVPNPFNAETLIRFDLPSAETVSLDVFNALGQKVRTLVQGRIAAGSHQMRWDSRDERGQTMATGPYFYRLIAGNQVQTQRMMLVK